MTASTSAGPGNALLIIERILRDREGIWQQIGEERDLGRLIKQMLVSSAAALACYGIVLGASNGVAQAAVSAVKLPLLFLMTLAICLPTLYLFNLVFGARLQVKQAIALVMVTITVTAVLTLAFAPISLFFLTATNDNYSFYKLLNVAILTLSAVVGLRFLTAGMAALNAHTAADAFAKRTQAQPVAAEQPALPAAIVPVSPAPAGADKNSEDNSGGTAEAPAHVPAQQSAPQPQPQPVLAGAGAGVPAHVRVPGPGVLQAPAMAAHGNGQPLGVGYAPAPYPRPQPLAQAAPGERPASMTLLYVWIMLFGFVGTQLAWTLRPFLGHPDQPFQIFRSIDGNFYVDIARTLGNLF